MKFCYKCRREKPAAGFKQFSKNYIACGDCYERRRNERARGAGSVRPVVQAEPT